MNFQLTPILFLYFALAVAKLITIDIAPAAADIRFQSFEEVTNSQTATGRSIATLSRDGMHFSALSAFMSNKDTSKHSLSDTLAAARSAWALGYVQKARDIWDSLFANPALDEDTGKYNAILSRAIMELQEQHYEAARAFAEEGTRDLEASDLRAQFWLVIAESLREQGIISQAEKYYIKASQEAAESSQIEALYQLGECQQTLGKLDDARYSFAEIPVSAELASRALGKLIEIDLAQNDYESVLTWLSEAKQTFPSSFDDPWTHYVKVKALVEVKRLEVARKALDDFRKKHSTNSTWYVLAESILSSGLVKRSFFSNSEKTSKQAGINNIYLEEGMDE